MKIVISNDSKSDASQVKNYIDDISYSIKQIEASIGLIPTIWQGEDATSFINKYNTALQTLKDYENHFNAYYRYLNSVYDVYNLLENAYSNKKINTD